MSIRGKLHFILLSQVFLLATPSLAQDCDPFSDQPLADCSLAQLLDHAFEKVFPPDEDQAGDSAGVAMVGDDPSAEKAFNQAGEEVVDANRATTAPDPFASNLHASYQDFLNLLSFAINEVEESEDGQSLIVRLNPLRRDRHLLGLSLSLTKPSISELVTSSISGDNQSDVLKKVEAKTSDFDDQTWSLSYSWATPDCSKSTGSWCLGRQPESYRELLSSVLEVVATAAMQASPEPDTRRKLIEQLAQFVPSADDPNTLRLRNRLSEYNSEDQQLILRNLRELLE